MDPIQFILFKSSYYNLTNNPHKILKNIYISEPTPIDGTCVWWLKKCFGLIRFELRNNNGNPLFSLSLINKKFETQIKGPIYSALAQPHNFVQQIII